MNCSYFAMERRRTFKVNKKNKDKTKKQKQIQIQKTKQKNNKQADKPKQNKTKIYKRSIKYSKKFFLDSKIQHLIQ